MNIPDPIIDTIIALDDENAGKIFKAVVGMIRKDGKQYTFDDPVISAVFGLISAILGPILRRREQAAARRARKKAERLAGVASSPSAAVPEAPHPSEKPIVEPSDRYDPMQDYSNGIIVFTKDEYERNAQIMKIMDSYDRPVEITTFREDLNKMHGAVQEILAERPTPEQFRKRFKEEVDRRLDVKKYYAVGYSPGDYYMLFLPRMTGLKRTG